MRVSFTKMQGAGNDFVVLDETRQRLGLGARNEEQLKQNLGAGGRNLTPEQLARLKQLWGQQSSATP